MSEGNHLTGRNVQLPPVTVTAPVTLTDYSRLHIGHVVNIEKDRCLEHLRGSDPRLDKDRIQNTAGGLLKDSYSWIFSTNEYKELHLNEDRRSLWITGDPGKGKTMLLCGIIDELKSSVANSNVAFFFCQATDARINTATSVLRGLIFLLAHEQPSLLSHVRKKYDDAGKPLFEDPNAWTALLEIFNSMVKDSNLKTTWLIIDALDECTTEDLPKLLDFISKNKSCLRLKWILSSRNNIKIENGLKLVPSDFRLSLEENAESVSQAVEAYIEESVSKRLPIEDDMTLYTTIGAAIKRKAKGTFLWASLVIRELKDANEWDMEEVVENTPESLTEMYGQMFNQISQLKLNNSKYCLLTLSTVVSAHRPLSIEELRHLAGLPGKIGNRPEYVTKMVKQCGSFLTIENATVYLIHQSAKDFLTKAMFGTGREDDKDASELYLAVPRDIKSQDHAMFSRSLEVMSAKLKRNMYDLNTPGLSIDDVNFPEPDPLASVRYPCLYWVRHLKDCDATSKDLHTVNKFLRQSCLHWLEALSLFKSVPEGILVMAELEQFLQGINVTIDELR